MKFDEQGDIWLDGLYGIFRQQNDSLNLFSKIGGAYDLAFCGDAVAVAHPLTKEKLRINWVLAITLKMQYNII